MSKLKVTGYVDSADLPAEWVDDEAQSGLSEEGYDAAMDSLISGPLGMHDVDIERAAE